jgi:alpha-tubulin suppressor-like RCC1 family protein
MVTTRSNQNKPFDPASHAQHGASAISSVSVGGHHACAIHRNGQLYSWGMGSGGRLGQGDRDETGRADITQPCAVRGFGG